MAVKPYNSKDLTNHLRRLLGEAHDWTEADGAITKGEALARLLIKKALGYTEEKVDEEGKLTKVEHRPEAWAIQMIYNRVEGKEPQALSQDDEGRRVKAADQVRDLAKSRLNELAAATAGVQTAKGPPKWSPKSNA